MKPPTRTFLFDECIGKPVMDQLHQLVPTEAMFEHVVDLFSKGAKDRDWIPRLAKRKDVVVITGDGGRQSSKAEGKLPAICAEYGVTHIVLSPTLLCARSEVKVAAITSIWSEIELTHDAPPGQRFDLRFRTSSKSESRVSFMLVRADREAKRAAKESRRRRRSGGASDSTSHTQE